MTKEEIIREAEKLAAIYRLTDTNPRSIDPAEKERLYCLAGRYREIHYEALRINNARNRV
jgi:hypothetical protein